MVLVAGFVAPTSVQTVVAPVSAVVDCKVPPVGDHATVILLPDLEIVKRGALPLVGVPITV